MNAVEIEEAVSKLAWEPFDPKTFPRCAPLSPFGNKPTTIAKLKSGASNASEVPGGVLQRSNIHLAVCAPGEVTRALAALKRRARRRKTRATRSSSSWWTDGDTIEAEDLSSGGRRDRRLSLCGLAQSFRLLSAARGHYHRRANRASIPSTRATGRLNRLYIELLKGQSGLGNRRSGATNMNHFMARLIFCFFAEKERTFSTARDCSRRPSPDEPRDSSSTHEVICAIFRAIRIEDGRSRRGLPAEIARLALIIAEYQCDVLYRGQKEALAEFLAERSELDHL